MTRTGRIWWWCWLVEGMTGARTPWWSSTVALSGFTEKRKEGKKEVAARGGKEEGG
jgi:hypothetical protein